MNLPRARVGDSVVRKYWHNCSCGIVGGQAIAAKFGSILWNRWRNIESGLVSIEKSSLMVVSSFFGGRCGCVIIPWMALRDIVWMLIARSTKARDRDCGSYYRDPQFSNQVVRFVGNVVVGGRLSIFSNVAIKLEVTLLMAEVSGPLYQVKGV